MDLPGTKVDVWNLALDCIGSSLALSSENDTRVEAAVCRRHWGKVLKGALELGNTNGRTPWKWAVKQRGISEVTTQPSTKAYDAALPNTTFETAYFNDPQDLAVVKIAAGGGETTLVAGTDYTLPDVVPGNNPTVVLAVALTAGQSLRTTVTIKRVGWEHIYALPADCVTPLTLLDQGTRYVLLAKAGRIEWEKMSNDRNDGFLICTNAGGTDFDRLEYVSLFDNVLAMPSHFVDALMWRLAVPLANAIIKDPKRATYCEEQYGKAISRSAALSRNVGNEANEEPETPSITARG